MSWLVTSLLSMGAVFAIFAAYYNWGPLITGYMINEHLGKIQYWIFFIGVNILFFPMHFLGLAGMPRRIPDYPDAYIYWNSICTIGSCMTIISVFLFIYILFDQLHYKRAYKPYKGYVWSRYDKPYDTLDSLFTRVPKYHTYHNLPIL